MKREDFKEIKETHFETCEDIIKNEGRCITVRCSSCPFYGDNLINSKGCTEIYSDEGCYEDEDDIKLLNSAKEFLKFRNTKIEVPIYNSGIYQTDKFLLNVKQEARQDFSEIETTINVSEKSCLGLNPILSVKLGRYFGKNVINCILDPFGFELVVETEEKKKYKKLLKQIKNLQEEAENYRREFLND